MSADWFVRYSILSEATFAYCEKIDNKELRVSIKHCFLAKKNTVETKVWLDKHYSDSALAKSTIKNWFAKFKRGEMSIEDIKKVDK
jgi:hypothetical protein